MKRSINIGIILFLLLQACSGGENIENQTSVEPIPEDTPINSSEEPEKPAIKDNNSPNEGNKPPPPKENNPPNEGNKPPPPGGNDIDRAIQIIQDADDDILDCIARAFPTDSY